MLGIPGKTVEPRELSPLSGTSILIISAPRSAISMYGTVPACAVEQATIFTPAMVPSAVSTAHSWCFLTRKISVRISGIYGKDDYRTGTIRCS